MHSDRNKKKTKALTIILSGGSLPPDVLNKVWELRTKYSFDIYLSTAQNLRLYNINETDHESIRVELLSLGVDLKKPGLFPSPRVCIGNRSCDLGQIDTIALSDKILGRFGGMTEVKPKFKMAIAGCPAACSNTMLSDIGIVSTRSGFDIYLGGKGGPRPKIGKRVVKGASEEKVFEVLSEVVEFHNRHAGKKMRFWKHLENPEFPYRIEI